MFTNRGFPVVALVTVALGVGCSSSPEQDDYEDEAKSKTVQGAGGGSGDGAEKIAIPLSVDYGFFALTGTAATAWSVDLAGCTSGYTATVTQANLDGVEVYKDDRTCLAKLTAFTAGGISYSNANPGATDFTTWVANDTALFTSAGGDVIRVKIISQLASPISGTEAVVYNFSELLDGTGDYTFSEAEVSDAHSITVESQEAPHFDVVAATYVGMDDATGAAEFTFKLECVDDPTSATPTSIAMSAGTAADSLCGATDLDDIEYKLVKDTYGSTLDIADAEAIFGTAGSTVTMPGDQYADSPTNEGFTTSTLDGPGALGTAGNENMILILKAGLSYTYYNIDVTTISQ
jgi:hypothetical protein